jgi:flagellar biosynthesis/type III secretory pathway chaperone
LNFDESHNSWEPPSNFTDPKFITEYWRRIGEIPESITAINKANKELLRELKSQNNNKNSPSGKRKNKSTESRSTLIHASTNKKRKRS